jgi:hypothetical protein
MLQANDLAVFLPSFIRPKRDATSLELWTFAGAWIQFRIVLDFLPIDRGAFGHVVE